MVSLLKLQDKEDQNNGVWHPITDIILAEDIQKYLDADALEKVDGLEFLGDGRLRATDPEEADVILELLAGAEGGGIGHDGGEEGVEGGAAVGLQGRDEAFLGEHVEFYQVSSALSIEYDMVTHSFLKFDYNGKPIEDDKVYTVGLQDYHFKNLKDSFDLELKDIEKNHMHRAVATSCADVLEEVFKAKQHLNSRVQGRLILHLTDEAKQALLESGR